jgi:hypothetical protein
MNVRRGNQKKSTKSQPLPRLRSIGYLDLVAEQGELSCADTWDTDFAIFYDNETETAFTVPFVGYLDAYEAISVYTKGEL